MVYTGNQDIWKGFGEFLYIILVLKHFVFNNLYIVMEPASFHTWSPVNWTPRHGHVLTKIFLSDFLFTP